MRLPLGVCAAVYRAASLLACKTILTADELGRHLQSMAAERLIGPPRLGLAKLQQVDLRGNGPLWAESGPPPRHGRDPRGPPARHRQPGRDPRRERDQPAYRGPRRHEADEHAATRSASRRQRSTGTPPGCRAVGRRLGGGAPEQCRGRPRAHEIVIEVKTVQTEGIHFSGLQLIRAGPAGGATIQSASARSNGASTTAHDAANRWRAHQPPPIHQQPRLV